MEYQPRPEQAHILEEAMRHINSVPYDVSARWLFYRLRQGSLYRFKEDYHGKFLPLTAKARKQFYKCPSGQWRPDTLADDTRGVIDYGLGFDDERAWLEAIRDNEEFAFHRWLNQPYYMELWFEAKAMRGQFEYYTEELPLLPFGGDVSIDAKWKTARRLERRGRQFDKPVVVLYFGDDDPKGQLIPESALADIRVWCPVDFDYVRVGLNPGDGERMGIPENPEKPGTYQWEALDDDQAGELIKDAVAEYYDTMALENLKEREQPVTKEFRRRFQEFIFNWEDVA